MKKTKLDLANSEWLRKVAIADTVINANTPIKNNTPQFEKDLSGCNIVCVCDWLQLCVISAMDDGKCSPEWHATVCVMWKSI